MRRSAIFILTAHLLTRNQVFSDALPPPRRHRILDRPLDWSSALPDQSMRRLMPDADEPRRAALLHNYRLCYDAPAGRRTPLSRSPCCCCRASRPRLATLLCTSKREDFAVRISKNCLNPYFLAVYADTVGSLLHTRRLAPSSTRRAVPRSRLVLNCLGEGTEIGEIFTALQVVGRANSSPRLRAMTQSGTPSAGSSDIEFHPRP